MAANGDVAGLLLRVEKRMANLERNLTLLQQAYQQVASQIGSMNQALARCPVTCPYREANGCDPAT
jgi:hypothetical protein